MNQNANINLARVLKECWKDDPNDPSGRIFTHTFLDERQQVRNLVTKRLVSILMDWLTFVNSTDSPDTATFGITPEQIDVLAERLCRGLEYDDLLAMSRYHIGGIVPNPRDPIIGSFDDLASNQVTVTMTHAPEGLTYRTQLTATEVQEITDRVAQGIKEAIAVRETKAFRGT